jgi:3'-phosphoadenosine 5'-phosphosulfate sulfotransferase (PAPS reductase)/FAD synthetase
MAESSRARRDPEALIGEATARWRPIKTYCLFSGGGDSGALAHRCRNQYDELLYIDTGTAIPTTVNPAISGVENHVRSFAATLGKPLTIRRSGDAYRTMVLGDELWWRRFRAAAARRPLTIEEMIAEDKQAGLTATRLYGNPPWGFPGPGQHLKAYTRLKERRLDEVRREAKLGQPRSSTVLFLSGVRQAESRRRSRRDPFASRGSAKFCSPLIDWTASQIADYLGRYDLPLSDIAALLHRSGECNCGAFAQAEEERAMMRTFWPKWWTEGIEALEAEAEALGIRWCRWGGFDLDGNRANGTSRKAGVGLCSSCGVRSLDATQPVRSSRDGRRRVGLRGSRERNRGRRPARGRA